VVDIPQPHQYAGPSLPSGVGVAAQAPQIPLQTGSGLYARTVGSVLVEVYMLDSIEHLETAPVYFQDIPNRCQYRVVVLEEKSVELSIIVGDGQLPQGSNVALEGEGIKFEGDHEDELIFGTPRADKLFGAGGNDVILGYCSIGRC
jgi:hypothetical protein